MCAANSRFTAPLSGQGENFTLFEKIISDIPRVGFDTHGDASRVGLNMLGDVTRRRAEENGDIPTQSPQGVAHLELEPQQRCITFLETLSVERCRSNT